MLSLQKIVSATIGIKPTKNIEIFIYNLIQLNFIQPLILENNGATHIDDTEIHRFILNHYNELYIYIITYVNKNKELLLSKNEMTQILEGVIITDIALETFIRIIEFFLIEILDCASIIMDDINDTQLYTSHIKKAIEIDQTLSNILLIS